MTHIPTIALVSLLALGLGGAVTSMGAQPPTVTAIRVDVSRVAAPTVVVATVTIPIAQPSCNLLPAATVAVTVNPTNLEYDDPANVGKVCRAAIFTTVNALAPDHYQAKAVFVYSDGTVGGTSAASNPFTRFDSSTPAGLRFVR